MSKLNYNNDVLTVMFEDIKGTLVDHTKVHATILDTVKTGFEKTNLRQDLANGRTRKNELAIAFAQGGLAIVTMIIVPMLGWALWTLVHFPETMNKAIQDALSVYEIP